MGSNNFTLFKPSGSSSGTASTSDYLKDAFKDISIPATSNSGLSSTISTNPLSGFYANDDAPKYGVKTLWIKDLVLIDDRSKWQTGQPTYKVIFHEQFPGVDGYVFGAPFLQRGYRVISSDTAGYSAGMNARYQVNVGFRNFNGGMGVTGKIRRVMWLTTPNNSGLSGTESGLIEVDGVTGASIAQNNADNPYYATQGRVYSASVHAASNETDDIHDYRLLGNGLNTNNESFLKVTGVVVYFENATTDIAIYPGVTYVDKSKKETTSSSHIALPTLGSSLGGRSIVFKDSSGGYQLQSVGHTPVVSVALGSSGTNQLSLITGHGASFKTGNGVIAKSGSSFYIGVIQSISTDTLTVGPTLAIGVSGDIYPYYLSSISAPIDSDLYGVEPAFSFGSTVLNGGTTTRDISFWVDPYNRYVLGINQLHGQYSDESFQNYDGKIWALYPGISYLVGGGGNLMVQGRCSAAEIEWYVGYGVTTTPQIHDYHVLVDGITTIVHNSTLGFSTTPKYIKHTILTESGPQWKQFNIVLGQSHGPHIGISKVNFYDHNAVQGVTFGHLAQLDTMQQVAYTNRGSSMFTAPGMYQRYQADQLYFSGGAARAFATTLNDGFIAQWLLQSTSDRVDFQWYGKEIMIKGSGAGGSLFITIDGVQNTSGTSMLNQVIPVANEGFHKLVVEFRNANTLIGAIDVARSHGEIDNLQNFSPIDVPQSAVITDWIPYACDAINVADSTVLSDSNILTDGRYKVIDDQLFIEIVSTFNGGIPDNSYAYSLPAQFQVDYKRMAISFSTSEFGLPVGSAMVFDASSNANFPCISILLGNGYIYPVASTQGSSYLQLSRSAFIQPDFMTYANGDAILVRAQLTIVKPGT